MTGKHEYILDKPPASESEILFRGLFENSGDAIQILENNIFVECNQATVEILRARNKEEVLSTHPSQLSPEFQPDGRPSGEKADEMIRTAMEKGGHRFEWMHRRMDGEDFPVEVMLTPVVVGGKTMLYSSWRDISDRKRAENELKRNVNFTNALLDAIPTPVFYKDKEGRYQGCNRAFTEIMGKTSDEIRGETVHHLWPSENADIYHQKDLELMHNQEHQIYESTAKDKDGNIRPVIFAKDVFYDESGNVAGLVGAFIDISESKIAEQRLNESEERYRRLSEASVEGVVIHDKGILLDANEVFAKMFGYELSEVIGMAATEFLTPETREITAQNIRSGYERPYEVMGLRKDGSTFPVEITGKAIPYEGRTVRVTALRDITERKNLEQQIQTAFERRGYQVQVSTEIAQEISQAAELSELFQRVVTLAKERLGYYHTQLLRYDPSQDAVVLINGYGEIGEKMLAMGHRMEMGRGLIGTAAALGQTVMRSTLADDPDWQPNPLLPDTKGEIAVPIKLGDQVLGVLDVQSSRPGALTEDDRLLLEGLCGQIAVAIEQTRLRQEMAEHLEEINRLYRAMSHEGWQAFREKADIPTGFMFDQGGLRTIQEASLAEELFAPIPLALPGGEVIGKVAVADEPHRPLTPDDQVFLEQVSEQVALALESARLFEQTQSALYESKESQKLIRNVIDSTDDWIFVKDREHRYQLVNRGYANALHISAEDFIGKNDLELGFPEELVKGNPEKDIRGFWADDNLVMDTGMPQHFPDDPATVDGRIRIFDTIKIPLRDASNNVWGVLAFARDLTERKQAEENLRASEAQLSEALDIARLGNWEYDFERDIFTFNDHFYSIFHTTAEEVGGYEMSSAEYSQRFVHPDDAALVGIEIEKALASTERHFTAKLEHRVLYADGGVGYIAVSIHLERDENGKIIRWYGANQDITERRQAQDLIAKRASQLQTVAALSSATSTLLDPDELLQKVVDLTKERFNLYHAHIYLVDDTGQTLLLAIGAGEVGRKMVAQGWSIPLEHKKSIVAQAARTRQFVVANDVTHDKDSIHLSNRLLPDTRSEMAVPMIVGDRLLGVFDVQSDQQDQFTPEEANIYATLAAQVAIALQNARLYQEQAATVTQLRELDRLKSSFLANMSHELRTPLNSILGFADVMLEELDGPLTENMNNDLQLIQKNGQHLLHLINDVLDMAKIEAGRMNLSPETFCFHEILEEVTSITSPLASEKSLSLFIESDSDQEVEVFADRTRLRQVMLNLVNNAMKFTEKGKISMRTTRTEDSILVTVHDTGIGIPPDKLETIFQEFTQVDSSSTRKAGGTGLGLPISRKLVEMHGGRLWAESTGIPGEGSTFYVELPLEARINDTIEKQEK
ncbi:MAG: PAS domain S-box protein [Chloroflexota bacterium]